MIDNSEMTDGAMRLSIALLSEAHWVAVVVDTDQCTSSAAIPMRREAVREILTAHGFNPEEAIVTRVIEFLPDMIPFKPLPITVFSDLAALLRGNLTWKGRD